MGSNNSRCPCRIRLERKTPADDRLHTVCEMPGWTLEALDRAGVATLTERSTTQSKRPSRHSAPMARAAESSERPSPSPPSAIMVVDRIRILERRTDRSDCVAASIRRDAPRCSHRRRSGPRQAYFRSRRTRSMTRSMSKSSIVRTIRRWVTRYRANAYSMTYRASSSCPSPS